VRDLAVLVLHLLVTVARFLGPGGARAVVAESVLVKHQGPTRDVIAAVVDMKRRNPTWGCPRITQQIALAFGISINKAVVRRILAERYRPEPESAGPSWLTFLGQPSCPESSSSWK
jgi:hypothetical protein